MSDDHGDEMLEISCISHAFPFCFWPETFIPLHPLSSNWVFLFGKAAVLCIGSWEPHAGHSNVSSRELLKKWQPRAQRVPLWAFSGNWPLLLCFGRWGASSRDSFWPTTPPQQLPQPSCSLRYVLSQLMGNTAEILTDHWEITDYLCGDTLSILLTNLYKWHILAV